MVENAPIIIIFWFFIVIIFILMVVSMIAAIAIHRKVREGSTQKMQFIGKLCLALSIICSIPIFLVVVYILYIYI